MQPLPITFIPSEGQVNVHKIFDCDFCNDTKKIEGIDLETGYGTGYYKPCTECASEPDVDSQGLKD